MRGIIAFASLLLGGSTVRAMALASTGGHSSHVDKMTPKVFIISMVCEPVAYD